MDPHQPVSTAGPTVLATILATSLLSGVAGYFIGLGSSLPSITNTSTNKPTLPTSESEDTDTDLPSPSSTSDDFSHIPGECKLVLCVRTDLNMTKGKIAAQCGHATLACYKSLHKTCPTLLKRWERAGQAKIALKIEGGEEELELLQAQAESLGITARVIHDAGRTQIAAGSATVLGIGPAPKSVIDQVTGHLKLL